MATFTEVPSFSCSSQRKPRVLAIRFGDGYEQRAADGLNPDLQVWQVTFSQVPTATADTIEGFFMTYESHVTPFVWTPPRALTSSNFLCRSWTRTIATPTTDTITATFEEVAD